MRHVSIYIREDIERYMTTDKPLTELFKMGYQAGRVARNHEFEVQYLVTDDSFHRLVWIHYMPDRDELIIRGHSGKQITL